MKDLVLGTRTICKFCEPLVVADIGANFNGDIGLAKDMISRAKDVGVDVVKFQSWRKETLLSASLYRDKAAEITVFGHKQQGALLDFLSLSEKQLWEMRKYCDNQNILFSSTPFSLHDVDVLIDMDVPFIKIASMDLNHISFLRYVAKKQVPVILSTGMGTIEEIRKAVEIFESVGNEQLILLHCTALYPPLDDEVNLNNIDYLREVFDCPVGYSDHTVGYGISLAAAAKGACVIEKHYTLDKTLPGWDHVVSATPEEFKVIVEESKRIIKALGHRERVVGKREMEKRKSFRRSIVAKRDLPAGTKLASDDIDFKRPGTEIAPSEYINVINRKLKCVVKTNELLTWGHFE
jgi:N-acetylneuraminate synthase